MGTSASKTTPQESLRFIEEKLACNKITVFSKSYCPYCDQAKSVLQSVGASFEVVELDQMDDGADVQTALAKLTGRRTVPNVFVQTKSIGGGSDVSALHSAGKLTPLLQQAGAL